MTNIYCFCLYENELIFFKNIITTFVPKELSIYVTEDKHVNTDNPYIYYSPKVKEELRELGYNILQNHPEAEDSYIGFIFSDKYYFDHQRIFNNNVWSKVRSAILNGNISLQRNNSYINTNASFIFFQYQKCALNHAMPILDHAFQKTIQDELVNAPDYMLNQFTYTGPWQFGPWTKYRYYPDDLKDRLEKALDRTLKPNKPTVSIIPDKAINFQEHAECLAELACQVNLIIFNQGDAKIPKIPGSYQWKQGQEDFNILLFGSDFVTAGDNSYSYAIGAMAGLKMIPFAASLDLNNKSDKISGVFPLSESTHEKSGPDEKDIFESPYLHLARPLVLSNMREILERIDDKAYWRKYENRLPEAQQEIFGDYQLEDAGPITFAMLKRVLETGKLGTYCTGLQVRQSYKDQLLKNADANTPRSNTMKSYLRRIFKK